MSVSRIVQRILFYFVILLLLSSSTLPVGDKIERVRSFTREIEFDYIRWTISAVSDKINQIALGAEGYIKPEQSGQLFIEYLDLINSIHQIESRIDYIYTDPDVSDPVVESADERKELAHLNTIKADLGPLAETIFQEQMMSVVDDMGLTIGGQAVPPILFHGSKLPDALIVSPREVIRQDADISLIPDLTLEQKVSLEERVDDTLGVSSLVVGIGGIGVYPTMVMQTGDLNWLAEVVSHEWVHNFLSLRPLGWNYFKNSEMRTINETAATIAGKEIGRAIVARFYPDLLPAPETSPSVTDPNSGNGESPPFDFRAEMHITRVRVDQMLKNGNIDLAEEYMEERRIFLWENGYHVRKINQAYFAFHGAYADEPRGAAGDDPVGRAVRTLRSKSTSLSDFLNTISWISSYEQLQNAVGESN